MKIKRINHETIAKLLIFIFFRPKTILTILFFLIVHFLGSLGMYLSQSQFISLIEKIGGLFNLNSSIINILVDICQLIFGKELIIIIIEAFLIALFVVILVYKITKDSRLKKDSDRIKSIDETSRETGQDVKDIKKELMELATQLNTQNGKSKVDASKVESGLTTIIKYCVEISRSGKPNQAIETLKQNKDLLNVLDKSSPVHLEFDIAMARALREASKSDEAISKNLEIISNYKNEIRPYLYLADMYLQVSDFEKYDKYHQKAKDINPEHPTLKNLTFIRKIKEISEGEKIELDDNDIWGEEGSFEKAHCYYIHSIVNNINGNKEKRDNFLEEAIKIDENYFYYKAQRVGYKIFDLGQRKQGGENILNLDELEYIKQEIEKLEFIVKDDDAPKRFLEVELLKLEVSFLQHPNNEYQALKDIINKLIDLFTQTRFDDFNDQKIITLFDGAQSLISKDDFNKLLEYIFKSKKNPSDLLVFILITGALSSFENIEDVIELSKKFNTHKLSALLEALKSNDEKLIINEIDQFNDIEKFKIILSIKDLPLRLKLIDHFADGLDEYKRKILINLKAGLLFESKDFETAIKLIQSIDLKEADAIMCEIAFDVARELGIYQYIERDSLKRLLELNAYPERKYFFLDNLAIAQFYLREFPEALINAKESLENGGKLSIDGLQFLLFIVLDVLLSEDKIKEAEEFAIKYNKIERDYKLSMKMSEIYLAKKEFYKATQVIVDATQKVENITSEQLLASSHQLTIILNASGEDVGKPEKVSENTFVKLDGIDNWFFIGKKSKSIDAISFEDSNDRCYKALIGKTIGDKIEWPGDDGRINKIKREIKDILFPSDYIGFRGAQEMQKMAQAGSPYIKMFEVGTTPESMKDSLMKFLGREEKIFKQFIDNKLPFSFYASLIGSTGNAFSKIRSYDEGFVNTVLNAEDWDIQRNNAQKALNGTLIHIDATSLFMLIETGTYKKILSSIPNFSVPSSAIDEHRNLIQKFSSIPKKGSLQIGLEKNDVKATMYDEESADKIKANIKEFCDYIQDKAKSVYGIGEQERCDNVIEDKIIPAVSDATIRAQQEADSIVMTEDPVYISLNSQFTKKRKPDHFSLLAVATILFEQDKICLDDYLDIFYWLSVYRLRFFSTNANFIINAIIQERKGIITVQPDLLDKFNLGLVWSEEYGTNINSVINVSSDILVALIKNSAITEDYLRLILPKIYIPVLKNRNDHFWAKKLLQIVAIKIKHSSPIYTPEVESKFVLLQTVLNEYLANKLVIK